MGIHFFEGMFFFVSGCLFLMDFEHFILMYFDIFLNNLSFLKWCLKQRKLRKSFDMATIKMLQYLSLGYDEPWASVPSFI